MLGNSILPAILSALIAGIVVSLLTQVREPQKRDPQKRDPNKTIETTDDLTINEESKAPQSSLEKVTWQEN